jgi:SAM-dependent methyltransferase
VIASGAMSELVKIRRTCRLCGSARLVCSVRLRDVPIVSPNVGLGSREGEQNLTRTVAPLDNYLCQDCGLVQLIHVVDPALLYRNYLYRTSISLGLAEHFRGLSGAVIARAALASGDLVVEFGSNDGTLLGYFRDAGMKVQGVDPAEQIAAEASARGIPTRADFFGPVLAAEIRNERGPARAVISNNAMANIDDLVAILAGVKAVMAPDGVFVFETQYALDVYEKTLLDVIYHEHVSIFSVQPVARAFGQHGLEVFDAEPIAPKGGSIRFWVQHAGGPKPIAARVQELIARERSTGLYDLGYYRRFSERIESIKTRLHQLIADASRGGRPIAAYGTSVGSAALIHQFELEGKLALLLDDTPFKGRLEGPGYSLPVCTAEGVTQFDPALIVILAWRYAEPIMSKHGKYLERGGQFVIPLPDISVKKI